MKGKTKRGLPLTGGKLEGATLTHMREVAYGADTKVFLHRIDVKHQARNDEEVLNKAEAKRQRRAERNKAIAQKRES